VAQITSTDIEAIKKRLSFNVRRVRNLVSLYDQSEQHNSKAYPEDILRSSVVMLHATMEDVLRGLLKWKKLRMRRGAKDLAGIAFHLNETDKGTEKVTLAQLAGIDGIADVSVNDLITDMVKRHYDKESFNNRRDVCNALEQLGLRGKDDPEGKDEQCSTNQTPGRKGEEFDRWLSDIQLMMKRRHDIVHQSDRNEAASGRHGEPRKIAKNDVETWITAVSGFLDEVVKAIEPKDKLERQKQMARRPMAKKIVTA
jgi:hypothetical protein